MLICNSPAPGSVETASILLTLPIALSEWHTQEGDGCLSNPPPKHTVRLAYWNHNALHELGEREQSVFSPVKRNDALHFLLYRLTTVKLQRCKNRRNRSRSPHEHAALQKCIMCICFGKPSGSIAMSKWIWTQKQMVGGTVCALRRLGKLSMVELCEGLSRLNFCRTFCKSGGNSIPVLVLRIGRYHNS